MSYAYSTMAQNLVSNGDYEAGLTNWTNLAGNGGTSGFSVASGNGNVHLGINALRANVTSIGSQSWDVQSLHQGFNVTPGITYTLNFWAKSSISGRKIRIAIQNTTYTAQDYTISGTWTPYSFVFTPSENFLTIRIHYIETGDFFLDDFEINDPNGTIVTTITPSVTYQEMVGFGGALTWYAERIIPMSAANRNSIYDLMFLDLGLDILRLKNWYYPLNYPSNKSITTMDPSWFNASFTATNQFYTQAKIRNPNIDVLLCSWSPPKALKSNGALPQGTLQQNNGQFMYKEFAQYWIDILDHIQFIPDYISIQNEPGYVNPGWETCEWRPKESGGLPGYDQALDSIYNRIKTRSIVPKMLGPEPENLGTSGWDPSQNTFRAFTTPIKNKPYLYGYNYHLYNYGNPNNITSTNLNIIRDEFNNHPNFMTEFSSDNYNWLDVGRMIHANLVEANTSAYIYWELIWDSASPSTMIGIDAAGNYTIKDNYYALKHFAKYIDKGYKRISAIGSTSTLNVSAFLNPTKNQITLVAINNQSSAQALNMVLPGTRILHTQAYRSVSNNYWQNMGSIDLTSTQSLPAKSYTTYVIDIDTMLYLLSFNGTYSGSNVLLHWAVSQETEVKAYIIERCIDPSELNWEEVCSVDATSSQNINHYDCTDPYASGGSYYYRIIEIGEDGNQSISPSIFVKGIHTQSIDVLIAPNPSTSENGINVEFVDISEPYKITIFDALGKAIESFTTEKKQFNIGKNYLAGIYTLRLQKEKYIKCIRFCIQ